MIKFTSILHMECIRVELMSWYIKHQWILCLFLLTPSFSRIFISTVYSFSTICTMRVTTLSQLEKVKQSPDNFAATVDTRLVISSILNFSMTVWLIWMEYKSLWLHACVSLNLIAVNFSWALCELWSYKVDRCMRKWSVCGVWVA